MFCQLVKIHGNDCFRLNNASKTFDDRAPPDRLWDSFIAERPAPVLLSTDALMPLNAWIMYE